MEKPEQTSNKLGKREKIGAFSFAYTLVCGLYLIISLEKGNLDVTVMTAAGAILGAMNTWFQLENLSNEDREKSPAKGEAQESSSRSRLRRALKGDDENAYSGIGRGADPDQMNNIRRGRED